VANTSMNINTAYSKQKDKDTGRTTLYQWAKRTEFQYNGWKDKTLF